MMGGRSDNRGRDLATIEDDIAIFDKVELAVKWVAILLWADVPTGGSDLISRFRAERAAT